MPTTDAKPERCEHCNGDYEFRYAGAPTGKRFVRRIVTNAANADCPYCHGTGLKPREAKR